MASLFGTWPESIEYSASKAGVLGILNGLRGRCKEDDIGLGMVAPYFVRTPLMPEVFEPPLGAFFFSSFCLLPYKKAQAEPLFCEILFGFFFSHKAGPSSKPFSRAFSSP